jgi:hypothetical protein
MPTIIGNSTIFGIGGNTGSTGNTGNPGPTGARGNLGSTAGPTGGTAIYISTVTFDSARNRLTFVGSNGTNLSVLEGFTGSTGYYSDSRGISATIAAGYLSGLSGIIGGNTFQFLGICGAGTLISSLSTDKTEILITPNVSASSPSYGSTLPNNYIAYTTSSFSATTTKIGITGTNSILSFGLTADNGATGNSVKVFTDFNEIYFGITGGITLGFSGGVSLNSVVTGYDSGGLVLDLTKYTTYKTTAPIGITAFTSSSDTGAMQAYTFFIEGAEVWNFPKNVYFENTNSGICGYGFLDGMNIVHLWSDNAGLTFNAAFVARGIGEANSTVYTSQIGSCCYSAGTTCLDYTTLRECNLLGGNFNPLKPCSETCVEIGSCCSENTCYENTPKSVCAEIAGTYSIGPNCTSAPCEPKTYDLVITELADPLLLKTVNKLFTATIQTTDTDPVFVSFPSGVISNTSESFNAFYAILPDQTVISDMTELTNGTTLGFYFDNTNTPTISGALGTLPVLLQDTNRDTQKVKNIDVVYRPEGSGCDGCVSAFEIVGGFETLRYCNDCYTLDASGFQQFSRVQSQSGTINFCISNSGCGFTLSVNCINVDEVLDLDDCKITGANVDDNSLICPHREYQFLDNNCVGCENSAKPYLSLANTHCKGATLDNGVTSGYYYTYNFNNEMYGYLNDAGITAIADITKIEQGLKSVISNSKKNNKPLLYNKDNMLTGVTYTNYATCCPVNNTPDIVLDFSARRRIFVYQIQVARRYGWNGHVEGEWGTGLGMSSKGSPCNGVDGFWDYYYALVSAEVDATDSIMPPPTNSCMTIIPFAQILEGIIKRDCTFDSLLTVTNLFNFNFLGEIINGTNDVKIKDGKLVWNNNPIWFSDYRFFQSEVFQGYPASGLARYSHIFHLAIGTPFAEKLKRNNEFRRYFWGPGYCNGGDFNTVLCSNTTQNECILSSSIGVSNSIKTNPNILDNLCYFGYNHAIELFVGSDPDTGIPTEITPTLYDIQPNGSWIKNTTAVLFLSRLDTIFDGSEGDCLECLGRGMSAIISGTTYPLSQNINTDSLFYVYYNGGTFLDAKPIQITEKYTTHLDPASVTIPELDFTHTYSINNNDITLNLELSEFVKLGAWEIDKYEWVYWWELPNGEYSSIITWSELGQDLFELYQSTASMDSTMLKVYNEIEGQRLLRYVVVHVLFTARMIQSTYRGQEVNKIIKIYLDTPSNNLVGQSTIQNKKINNQCVAIDCSGVEFYCSGLKDC